MLCLGLIVTLIVSVVAHKENRTTGILLLTSSIILLSSSLINMKKKSLLLHLSTVLLFLGSYIAHIVMVSKNDIGNKSLTYASLALGGLITASSIFSLAKMAFEELKVPEFDDEYSEEDRKRDKMVKELQIQILHEKYRDNGGNTCLYVLNSIGDDNHPPYDENNPRMVEMKRFLDGYSNFDCNNKRKEMLAAKLGTQFNDTQGPVKSLDNLLTAVGETLESR